MRRLGGSLRNLNTSGMKEEIPECRVPQGEGRRQEQKACVLQEEGVLFSERLKSVSRKRRDFVSSTSECVETLESVARQVNWCTYVI